MKVVKQSSTLCIFDTMKLIPGEKVRFLNEAIEGVVTKLLNNDRVEVTDEFGFTHTAPEKFLVRVEFNLGKEIELHDTDSKKEEKETDILEPKRKAPPANIVASLEND